MRRLTQIERTQPLCLVDISMAKGIVEICIQAGTMIHLLPFKHGGSSESEYRCSDLQTSEYRH